MNHENSYCFILHYENCFVFRVWRQCYFFLRQGRIQRSKYKCDLYSERCVLKVARKERLLMKKNTFFAYLLAMLLFCINIFANNTLTAQKDVAELLEENNSEGYEIYQVKPEKSTNLQDARFETQENSEYMFKIDTSTTNAQYNIGYKWSTAENGDIKYISQSDNGSESPYLQITFPKNVKNQEKEIHLYGCIWMNPKNKEGNEENSEIKECYKWTIQVKNLGDANLRKDIFIPSNKNLSIGNRLDIVGEIENQGNDISESVLVQLQMKIGDSTFKPVSYERVGRLQPADVKKIHFNNYVISSQGKHTFKICIADRGNNDKIDNDKIDNRCTNSISMEVDEKSLVVLDLFSLFTNPHLPTAEEETNIIAIVHNIGNKDANSLQIEYNISTPNEIIHIKDDIKTIESNSTKISTINYEFKKEGGYTIKACIADKDDISYRSNNDSDSRCKTETISVSKALEYATYRLDDILISNEKKEKFQAQPKETIQIGVELENNGTEKSQEEAHISFSVKLENGSESIIRKNVTYGILQPNTTTARTINYTFFKEGKYEIIACIDKIGKKDEIQNKKCKSAPIIIENKKPHTPSDIWVKDTKSTAITIIWSKVEDGKDNIYYYITYKESTGAKYIDEILTTSTEQKFEGLSPHTTYEFKVRAQDDKGAYSEYASITAETNPKNNKPLGNIPPTRPGEIEFDDINETSITISWEKSIGRNNDNILYDIYIRQFDKDFTNQDTQSESKKIYNDLQSDMVYYFKVQAKDDEYKSVIRESIGAQTKPITNDHAPSPPENMEAKATTYDRIKIVWDASIDLDLMSKITYLVSYKNVQDGSMSDEFEVSGLSYIFSNLESNTEYRFKVRAHDGIHYSNYSNYLEGPKTDDDNDVKSVTHLDPISQLNIEANLTHSAPTHKAEEYFYIYNKGAYDWLVCRNEGRDNICRPIMEINGPTIYLAKNSHARGSATIAGYGFKYKYNNHQEYIYIDSNSRRVFKLGEFDEYQGEEDVERSFFKELKNIRAKRQGDHDSKDYKFEFYYFNGTNNSPPKSF